MEEIETFKLEDWHVHLPGNDVWKAFVPKTNRYFVRAIIMQNLVPSILEGIPALKYKERLKNAIPKND